MRLLAGILCWAVCAAAVMVMANSENVLSVIGEIVGEQKASQMEILFAISQNKCAAEIFVKYFDENNSAIFIVEIEPNCSSSLQWKWMPFEVANVQLSGKFCGGEVVEFGREGHSIFITIVCNDSLQLGIGTDGNIPGDNNFEEVVEHLATVDELRQKVNDTPIQVMHHHHGVYVYGWPYGYYGGYYGGPYYPYYGYGGYAYTEVDGPNGTKVVVSDGFPRYGYFIIGISIFIVLLVTCLCLLWFFLPRSAPSCSVSPCSPCTCCSPIPVVVAAPPPPVIVPAPLPPPHPVVIYN